MGINALRVAGLLAEDGLVVVTAGSQIDNPRSILKSSQFSSLLL